MFSWQESIAPCGGESIKCWLDYSVFFHRFLFVFILGAETVTPDLKTIGFPSLDPRTHQLTTRWGSASRDGGVDQGICTHLQVHLMERGWTGKLARADCGLAGFDFCNLNREEELVIKLDIRQCRVQQFRWIRDGLIPTRFECSLVLDIIENI